jgi:hypothetical protein
MLAFFHVPLEVWDNRGSLSQCGNYWTTFRLGCRRPWCGVPRGMASLSRLAVGSTACFFGAFLSPLAEGWPFVAYISLCARRTCAEAYPDGSDCPSRRRPCRRQCRMTARPRGRLVLTYVTWTFYFSKWTPYGSIAKVKRNQFLIECRTWFLFGTVPISTGIIRCFKLYVLVEAKSRSTKGFRVDPAERGAGNRDSKLYRYISMNHETYLQYVYTYHEYNTCIRSSGYFRTFYKLLSHSKAKPVERFTGELIN